MAFSPHREDALGLDSPHQRGEVFLSLIARHKSLEGSLFSLLSLCDCTPQFRNHRFILRNAKSFHLNESKDLEENVNINYLLMILLKG